MDLSGGHPPSRSKPRPWLSLPSLAWRQLRRSPATACFLVVLWVTGVATGSVGHGPSRWLSARVGFGLPALAHGFWWTPLSAGLWDSGLAGYLVVTALAVLFLGPAERRLGVGRALAVLAASQLAGLLLAAGLVRLAEVAREPWLSTLGGQIAFGATPGLLGVGFALSGTLPELWRHRLRLLITVAVTIGALSLGHLEQISQACGAAVGFAVAARAPGRARPRAAQRRSQHEVRVLVGLLVAAPAVGGVLAALAANADGPMSLLSVLFPSPGPASHSLSAVCRPAELAAVCRELRRQQLYAPWPGVPVQAAPALLLLLSAYGLRRGRRLAWWLATVINLSVLAAAIQVDYATRSRLGGPGMPLPREAMLLPVVTVVVLLVTRRRFGEVAGRPAARRLAAVVAAAIGASCGEFLLLGFLLRDQSGARPQLGRLVLDLPALFLPGRMFGSHLPPQNVAGRLLSAWVFLLFWVVVLGALTAFFLRTCADRDAEAAEQARAILASGGSTLSYMSTWRGNKHWISADGRTAIAYRVIGTVAVTVGEPYGDQAGLDAVIAEFARFCEDRGLLPCLYSVTGRSRAAALRLGWTSVQIAEDALLPLPDLTFAGKKWQVVRAAMNKAAREGITAQWCSFRDLPGDIAGQIREISGSWVADKGLPEMGFMLGGLAELDDPDVRCLIAVGADGTVHGITSWMPVYSGGRPVGWTIDLMRRNPDPGTCRGVMEFLIATAAMTFRDEGAGFVSLSAAPLARLDRGERPCTVQRLLDVVAAAIEPIYGFRSLLQFKAKFQPVYEPLYLIYPDPAALAPIGIAIVRAYLPDLSSLQALRLAAKLARPPALAIRLPRRPQLRLAPREAHPARTRQAQPLPDPWPDLANEPAPADAGVV